MYRNDIDFVGKTKGINWFSRELAQDQNFLLLIADIIRQRRELDLPKTTYRNILYAMFPAAEYLYGRDVFSHYLIWRAAVLGSRQKFIDLVANGTQGNIPQRALVILDYLFRCQVLNQPLNIIELGCAGGGLGLVFENCLQPKNSNFWKKYFWAKQFPVYQKYFLSKRDIEFADIHYQGCDLHIPDLDYAPFFIWDLEKRAKVKRLFNDFQLKQKIIKQSLWSFLDDLKVNGTPTFIVTSYLLYQMETPQELYDEIMAKVNSTPNCCWLDLSRNEAKLGCIFNNDNFVDGINYFSVNGKPIARAINSSDDWADWIYI